MLPLDIRPGDRGKTEGEEAGEREKRETIKKEGELAELSAYIMCQRKQKKVITVKEFCGYFGYRTLMDKQCLHAPVQKLEDECADKISWSTFSN